MLLENVAALLTRGMDRVHGELAALGYDSESHCIPAAAVGAPHIRDRVFVLAYANSSRQEWARGDIQIVSNASRRSNTSDGGEGVAYPPCEPRNHSDGGRVITGRFSPGGCSSVDGSPWAIEPDVGRVANGVPNRVDRLKGIGNAVVPQVAEYIGRLIMTKEQQNVTTITNAT